MTRFNLNLFVSFLAWFGLWWAPTTAAPLSARQLFPLSPSIDPFYNPPAGYETKAPGTILRSRSVVTSFFGLLANPVTAYQLLYRSTAVNGSAISTATTIFKPFNAKNDRFISFHTAYDSAAVQCNPSYTYQLGAIQTDLITSVETLLLEAYLKSGYIVASPDYEGPEAAFSAGHVEGMCVLDGMRAVKNFHSTLGLPSDPMTVGYGYSGGAIATGWAASLQPTYAPDLNVKGWAAGGTPSNLTAVIELIDNTAFSGFLPAAVAGLSKYSAYGAEIQPLLDSIITPYGQTVLDFVNNNCAVRDIFFFPEQSILSYDVQSLGPGLLNNPIIVKVLEDNLMGINASEAPRAPVYLYHATLDEIIPYEPAKVTQAEWCSQGSSVHFTTYAAGGHATTELVGFPGALAFINDAFAGNVASACSSETKLDETLNPLALGLNLEPITLRLIDALAAIGRGDSNIIANLDTLKQPINTS